jgi:thiosulfate dehydrogenase
MGRFLLGLIIGICLVAGGAYIYFTSGMVPVAATAQPMPFERMLAQKALHAKLHADAPKTVPIQPTTQNLLGGAIVYAHDCVFCHGTLKAKPSVEGAGMFPHAPQLFTPRGMVTDDPPGVTYWKVKNGIRLTGMPSFEKALTDQQIWQVSLLLSQADKLPPAVSAALAPTPAEIAPAKPATAPKHR